MRSEAGHPEAKPHHEVRSAARFPSIDAAHAEIARLSAVLTLPKGTVHVISDIHGEDQKLRHVINNASGTLRPLVEKLFAKRLPPAEFQEFLTLLFYPGEMVQRLEQQKRTPAELRTFVEDSPVDFAVPLKTTSQGASHGLGAELRAFATASFRHLPIFIQMQGAPGVGLVSVATVHRNASNDCHAQAFGTVAG